MSWAAMAAKGSTLTAGTTKVELPKEVVAAGRKVVLDSGAIIKGGRLESLGERFWTIQEVVNEIRDSNARMVLETTSADIQVRQVDPEALAFVTKFAKLTGDFAKLSTVDLKVMALTYQLEKQFCGTTHLNERPKPVGPRPAAADAKPEAEETAAAGDSASAREGGAEGKDDASEFERVPLSKPDELDAEAASKKRPAFKMGQNMPGWYDGEDDDKGWITPDNIQEVSSGHMESRNAEDEHVACATMDFAMQNVRPGPVAGGVQFCAPGAFALVADNCPPPHTPQVLLQIGLRVLNMDGMVVRSTKQFVLKCHGCYKVLPRIRAFPLTTE
jgi:RNA-binding protein NOB1